MFSEGCVHWKHFNNSRKLYKNLIKNSIFTGIQYIPRNMHTVLALLCFVVVIHWIIYPYPSGLLHWHSGNLTIALVPVKQPWWIWVNSSCELILIAANPWPMKSGTPTITFRDIRVFSGTLSGTFSGTLKILIYTIILNFVTFFFINIFSNQSYCSKGHQIANWRDFYLILKQVNTIAQWYIYFHCHAASLF